MGLFFIRAVVFYIKAKEGCSFIRQLFPEFKLVVIDNGQLKCGVSHHLTSWAIAEVGEHLWVPC